jgi:hypothetical protein
MSDSDESGETNFDLASVNFANMPTYNMIPSDEEDPITLEKQNLQDPDPEPEIEPDNNEENEPAEEGEDSPKEEEDENPKKTAEIPTASKSVLTNILSSKMFEHNFLDIGLRKLKNESSGTAILTSYKGLIHDTTIPQIDVLNLSTRFQNSYYSKLSNSLSLYDSASGSSLLLASTGISYVTGASSYQRLIDGFGHLIYALTNWGGIQYTFFTPACISLTALIKPSFSKKYKAEKITFSNLEFFVSQRDDGVIVLQYTYDPESASKLKSTNAIQAEMVKLLETKFSVTEFKTLDYQPGNTTTIPLSSE